MHKSENGHNSLAAYLVVYVDGLFHKLKKSGVGCQMSNYFIGCLLFADDVTLLCPTIKGLKKMIAICEQYAT